MAQEIKIKKELLDSFNLITNENQKRNELLRQENMILTAKIVKFYFSIRNRWFWFLISPFVKSIFTKEWDLYHDKTWKLIFDPNITSLIKEHNNLK
jgi:hypothetical protein